MQAKTLSLTFATLFSASALVGFGPASAQTNNEVMMSDNPSYCEVYNALSSTQAEECQNQDAPKTRGLTLTGTTQGLAITNTSQDSGTATTTTTSQSTGAAASSTGVKAAAFGSIQFEFNSFDLTAQSRATLDTVAQVLTDSRLQNQAFIIEGHTDAVGGDSYNQTLSERRAQAVVSYLVTNHSIPASRLKWRGRGESQPFMPSDPAAAINRRVVILNDQG